MSNKVWIGGFSEDKFSNLVGKLLTLADTLGLPANQAEAYKSLVKQEIWNLWEHPQFSEEKETVLGSARE